MNSQYYDPLTHLLSRFRTPSRRYRFRNRKFPGSRSRFHPERREKSINPANVQSFPRMQRDTSKVNNVRFGRLSIGPSPGSPNKLIGSSPCCPGGCSPDESRGRDSGFAGTVLAEVLHALSLCGNGAVQCCLQALARHGCTRAVHTPRRDSHTNVASTSRHYIHSKQFNPIMPKQTGDNNPLLTPSVHQPFIISEPPWSKSLRRICQICINSCSNFVTLARIPKALARCPGTMTRRQSLYQTH